MIKLNLEPAALRHALGVTPFASTDKLTPILAGVCIEGDVNRITVSATDRYKLARVTIPVEGEVDRFRVTVDAKALAAAVKAVAPLRAGGGTVTIEISDEAVRITGSTQSHELRTLEGDYPAVDRFFQQVPGSVEETLLAPAALKALADAARALGAKSGADYFRLRFAAPDKPLLATMPLEGDATFEAVVMPARQN